MMHAVATVGPLAVSVASEGWYDYGEGVFDGGVSEHPDLDHLVLLVGYGSDATLGDYWIIRNSWAPLWGGRGYMRVARHRAHAAEPCAYDETPLDGGGCIGGAERVLVCGQCGTLSNPVYPIVTATAMPTGGKP